MRRLSLLATREFIPAVVLFTWLENPVESEASVRRHGRRMRDLPGCFWGCEDHRVNRVMARATPPKHVTTEVLAPRAPDATLATGAHPPEMAADRVPRWVRRRCGGSVHTSHRRRGGQSLSSDSANEKRSRRGSPKSSSRRPGCGHRTDTAPNAVGANQRVGDNTLKRRSRPNTAIDIGIWYPSPLSAG